MTEEVQVAESPAPEQVATAEPATEASTPEAEQQTAEPVKQFSQDEVDALIGKRLAREQRKWEREQAARLAELQARYAPQTPQAAAAQDAAPADPYVLAEQIAQQREEMRKQAEVEMAYREREDDVREKYADFDQVAYNPALPITTAMAQTIHGSEIGPEIAYFLGTNPQEAARISRLNPFLQAKELGRIEAKLLTSPPAPRVSSAPPPIAPVTARSVGLPSYDTTDPRSVKAMSTSEWIEAERQRQIRKLEARIR